tara:strand:+ start:6693 stop:7025 length:333 start_codon:yes stop_codon:yes gene_type:complete
MNINFTKIEQLGSFDDKYNVWRQTNDEKKRDDIDPKSIYLVKYRNIWLLGRFAAVWYGWIFWPNMGSMHMQIEWLQEIYLTDMKQEVEGDTGSHVAKSVRESFRSEFDEE